MSPSESLPNCRRKALRALVASLASLALSWAGYSQAFLSDHVAGLFAGMGVGGLLAAGVLWWSPDMSDAAPKSVTRLYQRDFALAMGGYVAVMLVWKRLLNAVDAHWLRVAIALLPALLIMWLLRAFVHFVRDSDELHRRIELESGSIAALLVSGGYMAMGFLQSAKLIDVPSSLAMLCVFPAICFSYAITKVVVARRYL